MGLDVTAYKNIEMANGNEAFDETGELKCEEDWFQLYLNPHYSERASEIKDEHAYKAEDSYHFRAGSYGGYNHWRNMLAKLAGYTESTFFERGAERKSHAATVWQNPVPGPFMEIINFSDCEGTIGTKISKKLADDFANYQTLAEELKDEVFLEKYNCWRKAFELGAADGCIVFA